MPQYGTRQDAAKQADWPHEEAPMPAEHTVIAHDQDLDADAFSFRLHARAFAPHFHHAWVLGCVISGRRRLFVQGREYLAATGDVVIFRPGEVHACAPAGSVPFVWRGFHFRPGSAAAALSRTVADAPHLAGPVHAGKRVIDELLAAHALLGGAAPAACKRMRLFTALRHLGMPVQRPGNAESPELRRQALDPALEALRLHLETHAADRFTLEDMASLARMNKFRLIRAFARMTGATPYRYLESARVNRAQELLEQGLSPAEVALEAGFTDQCHLARAFRSRLGVTPGACRRRP